MIDSWDWLMIVGVRVPTGPPYCGSGLCADSSSTWCNWCNMAIFISRMFWLHFWVVGRSGDMSSIFIYSLCTEYTASGALMGSVSRSVTPQHIRGSWDQTRSRWILISWVIRPVTIRKVIYLIERVASQDTSRHFWIDSWWTANQLPRYLHNTHKHTRTRVSYRGFCDST